MGVLLNGLSNQTTKIGTCPVVVQTSDSGRRVTAVQTLSAPARKSRCQSADASSYTHFTRDATELLTAVSDQND